MVSSFYISITSRLGDYMFPLHRCHILWNVKQIKIWVGQINAVAINEDKQVYCWTRWPSLSVHLIKKKNRRPFDKQRQSFVPIPDDLSSFFTQCPSCVLRVVQEHVGVFSVAFAPKRPGALQQQSGSSSSSSLMCRPPPDSAEMEASRTQRLAMDSDLVKTVRWDNTRWVKMLAGVFYKQTTCFSWFWRRWIFIVWAFFFFRHSWHVWAIRKTPVCLFINGLSALSNWNQRMH